MSPVHDLLASITSPWVLGILGLCVGSFINLVVRRWPLMLERQWWTDSAQLLSDEASWQRIGQQTPSSAVAAAQAIDAALAQRPALSFAWPRSHCPHCGHRLRWNELLPVLGWLMLRGRCSACGTAIGWRYPAVEMLTALLFIAIGQRFADPLTVLAWCAAAGVLLALSLVDWDTTLLPDGGTQTLLWAGLTCASLGWTITLQDALWGAVAGYLALALVHAGFKLATGDGGSSPVWQLPHWSSRWASGREGLGRGDFKLLAALGAWLGWTMLVPLVLLASLSGAAVGLAMKRHKALREGLYMPFGPFLAASGLAMMLLGPERVMRWMGWA